MKTNVVILIGERDMEVFYTDEDMNQYIIQHYNVTQEELDEDREAMYDELEIRVEGGTLHDNRAAKIDRVLGE